MSDENDQPKSQRALERGLQDILYLNGELTMEKPEDHPFVEMPATRAKKLLYLLAHLGMRD
jgi:hypothetical protein